MVAMSQTAADGYDISMGRFTVAPASVLEALGKLITHRELDGIQQSVVVGIRLLRTLLAAEIPIGVLTALIGAPFFAVVYRKKGLS